MLDTAPRFVVMGWLHQEWPRGLFMQQAAGKSTSSARPRHNPTPCLLHAIHSRLQRETAPLFTDSSRHSVLWSAASHKCLWTSIGENVLSPFIDEEPIKRSAWAFKISDWLLSVQSKAQRCQNLQRKGRKYFRILITKQTNKQKYIFPLHLSLPRCSLCCSQDLPTLQSQLEADTHHRSISLAIKRQDTGTPRLQLLLSLHL